MSRILNRGLTGALVSKTSFPVRTGAVLALFAALGVAGCDRHQRQPSCSALEAGELPAGWHLDVGGIARAPGSGLRWFRCNAGERFAGGQCVGEALLLNRADAEAYVQDFSRASGRPWRLPTRAEMNALRRTDCNNPAVDPRIFPSVRVDHYWSGEASHRAFGLACSFYTFNGFGFCRELPSNRRPFWLVLDP